MFLMTSRIPSLTLVVLVTSRSYSHNFFLYTNGMSFQRSVSFLISCQIWFWSCESGTSTVLSSSIWFGWCWYTFLVSVYMKKKGQGQGIRVVKKNKTTSLWKKDEPERTQKLLLDNSCYKEFPCVIGILNLDCFQSVVESRGHAGKINS